MGPSKKPTRVIIIGAGLAGLSMANALQRAEIDHVVLEKHQSIVSDRGAAVVMWPHIARIMDQLGCLDDFLETCCPIHTEYRRTPDGEILRQSGLTTHWEECLGYPTLALDRQVFVEMLYNRLPDKSRVVTGKCATSIQHTDDGLHVSTADDCVEAGDILVGADGVHSTCRQFMWQHANTLKPGTIKATEKSSFSVTYKCLFGASPPMADFGQGDVNMCHNRGLSFFISTQPQGIYWAVFIQTERETRWPTRVRYTDTDVQETAARIMDIPITATVLFGELWNSRTKAGLVPLEEGVLDNWHSGRIVLVGDAIHKMTPDIGLGGACAIEDIVVLSNLIHGAIQQHPHERLSTAQIGECFQDFQDQQKSRAQRLTQVSSRTTRLHAWESVKDMIFTRLVLRFSDVVIRNTMTDIVQMGPLLHFIRIPYVKRGRQNWGYQVDSNGWPVVDAAKSTSVSGSKVTLTSLAFSLTLALSIGLYYMSL